MSLDSIWDDEGNYLNKKSKHWKARTTGCSCCSADIDSDEELKKNALDSLIEVIIAQEVLKQDILGWIKEAKKSEKYKKFVKEF